MPTKQRPHASSNAGGTATTEEGVATAQYSQAHPPVCKVFGLYGTHDGWGRPRYTYTPHPADVQPSKQVKKGGLTYTYIGTATEAELNGPESLEALVARKRT